MTAKGRKRLADIYVWDINTMDVLAHLAGFHIRAVCQVDFSPDGNQLLSIGQDDDNSLAIYDWKAQKLITSAKVDKDKVFAAKWKIANEAVTAGLKHIKFYTVKGSNIKAEKGSTGKAGKFEPILCICYAFSDQKCLTGTSKGNL